MIREKMRRVASLVSALPPWTTIISPSMLFWLKTKYYPRVICPYQSHLWHQKIQCNFTQEIPEMGHLGGGSERHVRLLYSRNDLLLIWFIDQCRPQSPASIVAGLSSSVLVRLALRSIHISLFTRYDAGSGQISTYPHPSMRVYAMPLKQKQQAYDYPHSWVPAGCGMGSERRSWKCK